MRLYKQNTSEEENRQTNTMNDYKGKPNFRAGMNGAKKFSATLMSKRESYRSEIRREYLKGYFEKKRVQFFGWRTHEQVFSHNQAILDIQINNYSDFTPFPQPKTLQPAYDNNYFKGVILLQRFISEQQHSLQTSQQPQFRYKTFYSFLISIIEENLDRAYFQQFTNRDVFTNHFNVLKNVLYSKLVQEMEELLVQVQQFNVTVQKQNAWAYQQILLETYEKLIWQITSFLNCQNIEFGKEGNWPVISIEEQMAMLLNILIEVTYYDEVQSEEQEQSELQNHPSYCKAYQKLSNILSPYQQQTPPQTNFPTKVNMTRMLIQNTDLISNFKFFIVFGQINQQQESRYDFIRREDEIRRRQRMIGLMMIVLRNVAINVGSDVLFEEGVVAELKCLLTEPLFKVEIRQHRNITNRKHYPFHIGDTCSPFHYQIQHFLILSFQMIRSHKTQQHLSQLDSFQFAFDVLQHIVSVQQQQKDVGFGGQQRRHDMLIQIGGEIGLFQMETNREGIQDRRREDGDCDCDQKEFIEVDENKIVNKLMQLAQSCIQCMRFHFILGEIRLQEQQQLYHYNTTQNMNEFSTRNRYIIKLNNIPDAQKVLTKFQKGQQLLKYINL